MLVSQAIVATGPLFFLLATLERPWWIAGAWIVWSAFAGLNICLPNLNMKFSTPQTRPATFALYYALTSVAYASSTLIGGQLYDLLKYESFYVGTWYFDVYGFSFYVAFVTRMLGLVFILAIDEPGSWKFSTMLARLRHSEQIGEIVKRHPLDRDA
jgi:predicted MFS family arabinose efflux permease